MMRKTRAFGALALLLAISGAQAASFIVERSTVRVKAEGYTASFPSAIGDVSFWHATLLRHGARPGKRNPRPKVTANNSKALPRPSYSLFPTHSLQFGVPNYGAILVGQVAYISDNAQGCSELFSSMPAGTDILLVDRGSCFFVEKGWHGQQAGAKAVIVADNMAEELLTMATPENRQELAQLVSKITIPTVLVTKDAGDTIKRLLQQKADAKVSVELDWSDSIAHPDSRVEWEVWFTTNDACGHACNAQREFFSRFHETASSLEQQGYTQFTPHVMVGECKWESSFVECDKECTNSRRYCAVEPVPAEYASQYNGAAVVEMNLRHLCAHRVANSSGQPARWWEFAGRFADACKMSSKTFDAACAHDQLTAAGIDAAAVEGCVGSPQTSVDAHPVLEEQLHEQSDEKATGRGRVIMLPTVVINTDQYRGSLSAAGVLRAICSGFAEGTEPAACLSGGLEVDECASGKHGCWTEGSLSACHDTFRGFVCRCPKGYEGDGINCQDIDECALGISGCDAASGAGWCENSPGSYECKCNVGYTLHGGQGAPGMCVPNVLGKAAAATHLPAWLMAILFAGAVSVTAAAGVMLYKQRMRQEMSQEVRDILRQYMPLDGEEADLGRGLFGGSGRDGGASAKKKIFAHHGGALNDDDDGDVEGGNGAGRNGTYLPPAAFERDG